MTARLDGASSGLGVAFAKGLAEAGAHVVLAARRKERLDEIALELNISPYEIRRKNAVESGHTTALNNYVRHAEYKKCLDSVVKRSGYLEKHKTLPFGKGIGLAGGDGGTSARRSGCGDRSQR